jgi:hypothetical protein
MAFTRAATSDTDPKVQTRAYGSLRAPSAITPFTAETAVVPRQAPGRSNLTFGSTNIPQPERTARDPDIAPSRNPRISGRQGGTGNPLGDAIAGLGKKFGGRIGAFIGRELDFAATRQGFEELESGFSQDFLSPSSSTPQISSSFTPPPQISSSFAPPTQSFTAPPPVFSSEGGFIRKRT